MLGCDLKTTAIARRQQFRLTLCATMPHRPYRMNNKLCRQAVSFRQFGVTGTAAVQEAALMQQLRPGGAMYRPVNPASAQQRRIRGIDDGIDLQRGDIGD